MNFFIILAVATAITATPTPQVPQSSGGGLGSIIGGIGQAVVKGMGNVTYGPAPKGCSKYEILVARGTGEPGPFGLIVGDGLVSTVTKAIPNSRGYAVQYPANMNLSYSPAMGIDDTINRLNTQNKACPDQKFALVGYSQGAGVMHGAMGPTGPLITGLANPRPILDKSVLSKIVAVVMFGDPGFKGTVGPSGTMVPKFPPELQEKLKENCAPGDPVCDPQGSGFQYHLMYVSNPYQSESAIFVSAGFKGQPLPKAIKDASDPSWAMAAAKNRPKPSGSPSPKGTESPTSLKSSKPPKHG